ncbi:MAG TPA: DNA adenine methylase [Erysipelotrichaceae bacterium]|nr:DNA adenine methylase [Erysipelotrichaceae bacterium]
MRYLGNKESICDEIINLILEKTSYLKSKIFFDAFCGTGTIANALKDKYDLILNDNMLLAVVFSVGRIFKGHCSFSKLTFNPIEYFNSNKNTKVGFFSKNYAPQLSGRMYFSDFNAGRIDFLRETIEEWKKTNEISCQEYCYLLACLLESVSKVSNVAGVYGAYLKTWDPRAIKEINFIEVNGDISKNEPKLIHAFNKNIHDVIVEVDCDILYLDPPYTKNKYSVQYHLLETLIRNDNPPLKGITGTRDLSFVSDAWSSKYKVDVEFEYVVAKTKARHIVLSYSSDGIMTKEYITNVLRRYGKPETLTIKEIPYKKYRNHKTFSEDKHFEYIFYIEKKDEKDVEYYCPLNYMGGKTNVIEFIKPELYGKTKFVDLMGGGFNVGINAFNYQTIIYNDINFIVKDLLLMFKQVDTVTILRKIETIIKKYGLEKRNAETYFKLRNDYNTIYRKKGNYAIYLYTLILYGFQQQIRFNSHYEFNNPVGESSFNDSVREKIVSFSRKLKEKNVSFYSKDFSEIDDLIDENCLVYVDPPYLITLGSYNDGKRGFNGWNLKEEKRLYDFLDSIKVRNCKIVISNILEYKGKTNDLLIDWIRRNNASLKEIVIRGRREALITYET